MTHIYLVTYLSLSGEYVFYVQVEAESTEEAKQVFYNYHHNKAKVVDIQEVGEGLAEDLKKHLTKYIFKMKQK